MNHLKDDLFVRVYVSAASSELWSFMCVIEAKFKIIVNKTNIGIP